jgi:hypothetical protein
MAATREYSLTGAWQMVARGYGNVIVTPNSSSSWIITLSDDEPENQAGHIMDGQRNAALLMRDGERLWLRGKGEVAVTSDSELD